MRKLILSLSVLFFVFTSCSNENEELKNDKVSSVLSEKNSETQRLMYNMLSADDKQKIWLDKIDVLLSESELSFDQKDLLSDLRNQIEVNIFDITNFNDERELFKSVYIPQFLNQATSIFTTDYIYYNFYTIGNTYSIQGRLIYALVAPDEDAGGGSKPDCSCNKGSIFSCAGISSDCKSTSSCTVTADGCGFLTMFECNGNCYLN